MISGIGFGVDFKEENNDESNAIPIPMRRILVGVGFVCAPRCVAMPSGTAVEKILSFSREPRKIFTIEMKFAVCTALSRFRKLHVVDMGMISADSGISGAPIFGTSELRRGHRGSAILLGIIMLAGLVGWGDGQCLEGQTTPEASDSFQPKAETLSIPLEALNEDYIRARLVRELDSEPTPGITHPSPPRPEPEVSFTVPLVLLGELDNERLSKATEPSQIPFKGTSQTHTEPPRGILQAHSETPREDHFEEKPPRASRQSLGAPIAQDRPNTVWIILPLLLSIVVLVWFARHWRLRWIARHGESPYSDDSFGNLHFSDPLKNISTDSGVRTVPHRHCDARHCSAPTMLGERAHRTEPPHESGLTAHGQGHIAGEQVTHRGPSETARSYPDLLPSAEDNPPDMQRAEKMVDESVGTINRDAEISEAHPVGAHALRSTRIMVPHRPIEEIAPAPAPAPAHERAAVLPSNDVVLVRLVAGFPFPDPGVHYRHAPKMVLLAGREGGQEGSIPGVGDLDIVGVGDLSGVEDPHKGNEHEIPAPFTRFRDALEGGGSGPEMVVIPAGEFMMGSPESEPGRYFDEGPRHRVQFGKPFALGVTAATFENYDRFALATGRKLPDDWNWGRGKRPVIHVGWRDATAYAEWLSQETSEKYRLPTEAEWEYAARAGSSGSFSTGEHLDTSLANYDGSHDCIGGTGNGLSRRETLPVRAFPANSWGLHEMHGNVWEWTMDCWHGSYRGSLTHGGAWGEGDDGNCSLRVIRGGSWNGRSRNLRSASRDKSSMDEANFFIGFRLARELF